MYRQQTDALDAPVTPTKPARKPLTPEQKQRTAETNRAWYLRKMQCPEYRELRRRRNAENRSAPDQRAKAADRSRQRYYADLEQSRKRAREMQSKYRAQTPERVLRNQTRSTLKKYGLTLEQYMALHAAQGGKCKICRSEETSRRRSRLCVDHCHKTGRVRGLLCSVCNRAIGYLKDDPARLRAAAAYLEASND